MLFPRPFVAVWSCGWGVSRGPSRRAAIATSSRAGFENVDVEPTRVYRAVDAKAVPGRARLSDDTILAQIDGRFMGAFVEPKPASVAKSCCSSACCA